MNPGWNLALQPASLPLPRASQVTPPPSGPRIGARLAGACYAMAVLAAVSSEALLHSGPAFGLGLVAVACFVVVTLILYFIFEPVSSALAGLAALANLVGLALEAFELHLRGANVALIFHGLYCILLGLLIFRSAFLPRVLGVLMSIAGLAWLTDLSIPLTNHLAPYNVAAGFLGEGLPMLWLLIVGVSARPRDDRVSAT